MDVSTLFGIAQLGLFATLTLVPFSSRRIAIGVGVGWLFATCIFYYISLAWLGASNPFYSLLGVSMPFYSVFILGLCMTMLLWKGSSTPFVFLITGFVLALLMAAARPYAGVFELATGSGTAISRILYMMSYVIPFLVATVTPMLALAKFDAARKDRAPLGHNTRPFYTWSIAAVSVIGVLFVTDLLLAKYSLDLRIASPLSVFLRHVMVVLPFLSFITVWISFGFTAELIERANLKDSKGLMRITLGAIVFVLLHYYVLPIFWPTYLAIGLILGTTYFRTGSLWFCAILLACIELFTVWQ
ncbi:MAG: CPBP family intramembrane metalloprotease [bacterium]|nr:CPBP family intramembrane metalloprotease [bacterium]